MIRLFYWALCIMYPPVWVKPCIFESWLMDAVGRQLDVRFMSEARRYREYGNIEDNMIS
jgi:hypothetical protein